ncbi:MAG: substrate-binding domain-containing protein [Nitrospiraceae bacterium]|nr:substrate-binding domain-containing protein [Nitrospiraceae bacterium]
MSMWTDEFQHDARVGNVCRVAGRWIPSLALLSAVVLAMGGCGWGLSMTQPTSATRDLIVATSPGVQDAMAQLGLAFEKTHPDVRVRLSVDSSLDLRRTIAGMENRGKSFIGSGPIHFIAPGGDEVITRMEQKYYLLPESKALYATERLVLVAPESLSEAPSSFESLAKHESVRIAVADTTTKLGVETDRLLSALGLKDKRIDRASDRAGILDHMLSGQADVGIMFGQDAVRAQDRVRVLAVAPAAMYKPIPHSISMERYCPDRALCAEFLRFVTSQEGQAALQRLGYGPGKPAEITVHLLGQ